MADRSDGLGTLRINPVQRRGNTHGNQSNPFDNVIGHQRTLVLSFPFKTIMMHHGIKTSGNSSKAKGDTCCSDTYVVVSDFCKLREVSSILVIIVSSSSTVCVAEPEREGTCCAQSPRPGFSLFPCACPPTSGWEPAISGVCMLSFYIGQSALGRLAAR